MSADRSRFAIVLFVASSTVTLGLAAVPSVAAGLPSKTKDGITYTAISNDRSDGMVVSDSDDSEEFITIRDHITIGGKTWKVREIGDDAFYTNDLIEVTLPETLKKIGYRAFANTELEHLKLPNSVRSIGEAAFRNTDLTSVKWSKNLKTIGKEAFVGTDLTKAILPNSVVTIGEVAFAGIPITKAHLSSSLTSLGEAAFAETGLKRVTIPGSLKSIPAEAFVGGLLTAVTIKPGVKVIGESAFSNNQLTHLTLPTSVKKIRGYAFQGNDLQKVVVPASVKQVGEVAFGDSDDLILRFKGLPRFDDPATIAEPSAVVRYESAADVAFDENGFTRGSWKGFASFMYPQVTVKAPSKVKDGGKVTIKVLVRAGKDKIATGEVKLTFGGVTKTFDIDAPYSVKKIRIPNVSGSGKTYKAKAVFQGDMWASLLKNKGIKKIKVVE